jgi:class 3 adenylate cyclase
MSALFAATYPERVSSLVLYGTFARMVRAPDFVGGIAVNIGARIGALAGPGEVLVSSTVRELVVGSGLEFAGRGAYSLKGAPGEWRLFAVV